MDARLFAESSALDDVVTGLTKIIKRNKLTQNEREKLDWAARLWGQMDWNSGHYETGVPANLMLTAMSLRPLFYKTLVDLGIRLTPNFSKRVYTTLESCGERRTLSSEELDKVKDLFSYMKDHTLAELQSSSYS